MLNTTNTVTRYVNVPTNPFHIVTPSPWPILTAFSFFGLMFNLIMLTNNYCNFTSLWILNVITLVYVSLLWGRDIIAESVYLGEHTRQIKDGLYMGYLIFLFTELMAFIGVFWAYFHSAIAPTIELGEMWPPMGIQAILPTDLPLLNTLILLASGATITYSHHGVIARDYVASIYGLLATIVLGVLFIVCQFIEYKYCSYTIADSVYGSTFFFLTGLHGIHLIGGTFFLAYSFYRMYQYQISCSEDIGFETTILLWHFLDIVWLFVYIIAYYWGT